MTSKFSYDDFTCTSTVVYDLMTRLTWLCCNVMDWNLTYTKKNKDKNGEVGKHFGSVTAANFNSLPSGYC